MAPSRDQPQPQQRAPPQDAPNTSAPRGLHPGQPSPPVAAAVAAAAALIAAHFPTLGATTDSGRRAPPSVDAAPPQPPAVPPGSWARLMRTDVGGTRDTESQHALKTQPVPESRLPPGRVTKEGWAPEKDSSVSASLAPVGEERSRRAVARAELATEARRSTMDAMSGAAQASGPWI